VVIDDVNKTKIVYIFRQNNELLISQNGKVEKAKWEYLDHNSLLIDKKDESYLFKQGFFDENVLALKIDGTEEYAFLVNETKYDKELNSLDALEEFLDQKYFVQPKVILPQGGNITLKYILPKCRIAKTGLNKLLNGIFFDEYQVDFEDGGKGNIYLNPNYNAAYFEEQDDKELFSPLHYYKDKNSCINALHHYLTTGGILKVDYLWET
jgi:hypothetical protein